VKISAKEDNFCRITIVQTADWCKQKFIERCRKCQHKTDTRYTKVLYQLWKLFYAELHVKMALAHPGGGGGCLAAVPPPRKANLKNTDFVDTKI
jgi:hypothetical protein